MNIQTGIRIANRGHRGFSIVPLSLLVLLLGSGLIGSGCQTKTGGTDTLADESDIITDIPDDGTLDDSGRENEIPIIPDEMPPDDGENVSDIVEAFLEEDAQVIEDGILETGPEDARVPWVLQLESCQSGFESCEPLSGYLRVENYIRASLSGVAPGLACELALIVNDATVTTCPGSPCGGLVSFPPHVKHAAIVATATCGGEQKTLTMTLPVYIRWTVAGRPCIRWAQWEEDRVEPPDSEPVDHFQSSVEVDAEGSPHYFAVVSGYRLMHLFRSKDGSWQWEEPTNIPFMPYRQHSVVRSLDGLFHIVGHGDGDDDGPVGAFYDVQGTTGNWTDKMLWPVQSSCGQAPCPFAAAAVDEDGAFEIVAHMGQFTPNCYNMIPPELQWFCEAVVGEQTHIDLRVRTDASGEPLFSDGYNLYPYPEYFAISLVNVSGPGVMGFYRTFFGFGWFSIQGEHLNKVPLCQGGKPVFPDLGGIGFTCEGTSNARVFALPDASGIGVISQFFWNPEIQQRSLDRIIVRGDGSTEYDALPLGQVAEGILGEGGFSDWYQEPQSDEDRAIMDGLGRNHFLAHYAPPVGRDPNDPENPAWEALLFFSEYGTGDPNDWIVDVLTTAPWPLSRSVMAMDEEGTTYVFASVKDEKTGKFDLRVWTRSCVEHYEPLRP